MGKQQHVDKRDAGRGGLGFSFVTLLREVMVLTR